MEAYGLGSDDEATFEPPPKAIESAADMQPAPTTDSGDDLGARVPRARRGGRFIERRVDIVVAPALGFRSAPAPVSEVRLRSVFGRVESSDGRP